MSYPCMFTYMHKYFYIIPRISTNDQIDYIFSNFERLAKFTSMFY